MPLFCLLCKISWVKSHIEVKYACLCLEILSGHLMFDARLWNVFLREVKKDRNSLTWEIHLGSKQYHGPCHGQEDTWCQEALGLCPRSVSPHCSPPHPSSSSSGVSWPHNRWHWRHEGWGWGWSALAQLSGMFLKQEVVSIHCLCLHSAVGREIVLKTLNGTKLLQMQIWTSFLE